MVRFTLPTKNVSELHPNHDASRLLESAYSQEQHRLLIVTSGRASKHRTCIAREEHAP